MVNVYTDPGVYVQYNNFRAYGGAQEKRKSVSHGNWLSWPSRA